MATPLTVQNVVVYANLGKELNLLRLGAELPEARYHSTGTPTVRLHIEEPKADTLIFSNGKLVCSGTRTLAEARQVLTQVKRAVKEVDKGIDRRAGAKLESVVASMELGAQIDLNRLAGALGSKGVEYSPTLFQGLVYRVARPRSTFVVFESGVLVVSDVASETTARSAVKQFINLMVKAGLLDEAPPVVAEEGAAEAPVEPAAKPQKEVNTQAKPKGSKAKAKPTPKAKPASKSKAAAKGKGKGKADKGAGGSKPK